MDWHGLQKKKVDELREMAMEVPGVGAVTAMSKEQLVEVVAEHLGIQRPHKVVTGVDKAAIKAEIRALKKQRDTAAEAKDAETMRRARREIRKRKRALRKAAHLE
jgi:superfamily II DNA helicase RecQ